MSRSQISKACFIAPSPQAASFGGSKNRFDQVFRILKQTFETVDWISAGPTAEHDIQVKFSKKRSCGEMTIAPTGYALYVVNYLFILEALEFPKDARVVLDLHDDLIERDERLGANWFTRESSEVASALSKAESVIHISKVEHSHYALQFPKIQHLFLPYALRTQIHPSEQRVFEKRYEFGFIGTQNSVNAHSLSKAVQILDLLDKKYELLVAGAISLGITKKPQYLHTKSQISLTNFYSLIKNLFVPHESQSGASTKIIESLTYGVPVITTKSLVNAIGIDLTSFDANSHDCFENWILSAISKNELWQTQRAEFCSYLNEVELLSDQLRDHFDG